MKPKETNTAPITPTEVHYTLRRCIIFSAPDEAAQLIADSEARAVQIAMLREYGNLSATNESLAKERDQLRAEVERADAFYQRACEMEREMRAELASEVERLTHACNRFSNDEIMQGSWKARAEKAEAELTFQRERNSRLFEQRDAAVEAQHKAEAELTAEREKVRALRDALTEIMENSSGWAESTAREALESAENVA